MKKKETRITHLGTVTGRFTTSPGKFGRELTPEETAKHFELLEKGKHTEEVIYTDNPEKLAKEILRRTQSLNPHLHSRRSPSTLRHTEICPAFVNDDESESKAADEGTLAHEYMELYCKCYTALTLEEKPKVEARMAELWNSFDDSMHGHLQKLIDYVTPYLERSKAIHTESKLDLRFLNVPACEQGTADLVLELHEEDDSIELMDWKLGRIEVDDAEVNIQFHTYAIGALRKFDKRQVNLHCLQPKRNEVSTHTLTADDEPKIMLRVKKIITDAEAPEPETRPCDDVCVWCKNLSFCPAVRKYALVPAYGTLPDLEKMVTVTKELLMNQPELAGQMQTLANILEKWASETKALCVQLAAEGNEVPGFKLIQAKGRRSCVDNVGLYRFLQDTYGVTPELFLTWCQVSVSKIESELGKTAPRGSQGKAAEQIAHEIAEQGFIQNGNPVMYLSKVKVKKE